MTKQKDLENPLKSATSLAGIGAWEYDCMQHKLNCSALTKEIFEFEQLDELAAVDELERFVKSPLQFRDFYDQIAKSIKNGEPFDFELEIVTANNNLRLVRLIGKAEFSELICKRIRGSLQDIDSRKRSEVHAFDMMREKIEILESIGDAFYALDLNWRVTYWNGKAERLLGKPKAKMIGHCIWDIYTDIIDTPIPENYHLDVQNQQQVHFEAFYQTLKTWYEISAYPSKHGLSVYFKDITRRKITEQNILESEKRYSDLFQLSPIPKWVFDMETCKFLDVNRAAIRHYGYSLNEFLKMSIFDNRPEEEYERTKKLLLKKDRTSQMFPRVCLLIEKRMES